MEYQIASDVEIDAPPETVWAILIDLDQYKDWNPFVVSSSGKVAVGERLTNRMQQPGGRAMTIRPTVTVAEANRTFEWLGHLGLPGIFDARHRFELEETGDGGTRVVHSEHFRGILVRPMRKSLDTKTLKGFEEMNVALKARAEAHSTSGT